MMAEAVAIIGKTDSGAWHRAAACGWHRAAVPRRRSAGAPSARATSVPRACQERVGGAAHPLPSVPAGAAAASLAASSSRNPR